MAAFFPFFDFFCFLALFSFDFPSRKSLEFNAKAGLHSRYKSTQRKVSQRSLQACFYTGDGKNKRYKPGCSGCHFDRSWWGCHWHWWGDSGRHRTDCGGGRGRLSFLGCTFQLLLLGSKGASGNLERRAWRSHAILLQGDGHLSWKLESCLQIQ